MNRQDEVTQQRKHDDIKPKTPLRQYIEANGITQKEIVIKLHQRNLLLPEGHLLKTDINKGWLSEFVNGKTMPHYKRLWAVAEVLNVTVDYLIGRNSDPKAGIPPKW
jgi:transcriptional regulator with XRE-family HTH domain